MCSSITFTLIFVPFRIIRLEHGIVKYVLYRAKQVRFVSMLLAAFFDASCELELSLATDTETRKEFLPINLLILENHKQFSV